MIKRATSLPVLVLVTILALVLGSFGTATAAGLTRHKVKKIATKVIKKQASALSVANASTLGGAAASAFQDRIAFTSGPSSAPLPLPGATPTQVLGPLSLTVQPGVDFVRAGASATLAAPGSYAMWLVQDQPCTPTGTAFDNRQFGSSTGQDSIALQFVFPVTAGVHTYRLCAIVTTATNASSRTLLAETVAGGATG